MAAFLSLSLLAVATTHDCLFHHVDRLNELWSFNLSALAQPAGDYEVDLDTSGRRIVTNVCRPPISLCNPPGAGRSTHGTPTAIAFWGPKVLSTRQPCGGAVCTQQCKRLGYGALGLAGSQWSLIDPASPLEGLRITHYALEAAADAHNDSVAPGGLFDETLPALDEWGAPRPPTFTLDVVCDATAPLPAAPLERVQLLGQKRADTSLRMRTRAACPTRSALCVPLPTAPAAVSGGDDDDVGDAASGEDGVTGATGKGVAAGSRPNGGGRSPWVFLLSVLSALAMLALLLLGFAPLSMRRSLRGRAVQQWSALDADEPLADADGAHGFHRPPDQAEMPYRAM